LIEHLVITLTDPYLDNMEIAFLQNLVGVKLDELRLMKRDIIRLVKRHTGKNSRYTLIYHCEFSYLPPDTACVVEKIALEHFLYQNKNTVVLG